jgi:hypothetical protein
MLLANVLMAAASAGLTVETFANSGLSGTPSSTSVVPDTTLISADGLSAFIFGTVTFPSVGTWTFDCTFANTAVGFFWIDGHLLCQDGNTYNTSVYRGKTSVTDNPLPIRR